MEYEVINKLVYGIRVPHLYLEITTDFKVDNIEIYINNILLKKKIKIENRNIIIDSTLPKNTKKIEVYILGNGNKILIFKKRYDHLVRGIKVITKPFRMVGNFILRMVSPLKKAIKIAWVRHHFLIPPHKIKRYIKSLKQNYVHPAPTNLLDPTIASDYNIWLRQKNMNFIDIKFDYNPLISIIIPVYNAKAEDLETCIESALNQTYNNFEICISDDNSTNDETINVLKKYENNEKIKIFYRKENGMISKNMNSAIKIASGEFIGFLDNDDILDKNALYYVVKELNNNNKIDLIYTDEDKMDENGRLCDPNFKPDWSPDTLLSMNYICHFTVIRKKILEKVGMFDSDFDGAQDYDLFLKVTEVTQSICHIPKVLYHWRKSPNSTAAENGNKDYARIAGKRALEAALERRKIDAEVEMDKKTPFYIINYKISKEPKVSIIIPTKDCKDILEKCINSIYEKTEYKNYEIVIVDNNSSKKETLDYLKKIKEEHNNIVVITDKGKFNYSRINNNAIAKTNCDYVLLLNNDTEVLTKGWLTKMVGYAMQKHVGCVGAKLLYPDYTVQHAGVILGLGGVASHAYIGADRNDLGYLGRLCVPYNYSANTAACLLVSRKKFDEVGGLEENLEVAYNDIDFNIKLLEKGYYNVTLQQVELIHYESKSRGFDTTPEKKKRFEKEIEYMMKKWNKVINNDKFYNKNFSKKAWFLLERRK